MKCLLAMKNCSLHYSPSNPKRSVGIVFNLKADLRTVLDVVYILC